MATEWEFDDFTYTHELRMRWARPDPVERAYLQQKAALVDV